MPSFTMELWQVLDLKPGDLSEDEFLGLSEYPIFDEDYREALNTKIKDHYLFQEIGQETISQFTFSLKRKMNEIMPLYNKLYQSSLIEFDPLKTVDIKTLAKGTQGQTSEGESLNVADSDVDSTAKNVSSNFPQTRLNGNADYATAGADSTSKTGTKSNVAETSKAENLATSDSESQTVGYQGNPAQLIMQARAALMNVDLLVISELEDLFMLIWNTGDSYTETYGRFI